MALLRQQIPAKECHPKNRKIPTVPPVALRSFIFVLAFFSSSLTVRETTSGRRKRAEKCGSGVCHRYVHMKNLRRFELSSRRLSSKLIMTFPLYQVQTASCAPQVFDTHFGHLLHGINAPGYLHHQPTSSNR